MHWVSIVAAVLKIALIVLFALTAAAVLTWVDRRQSAMMQDRVGPNRAEINLFGLRIRLAGLLHPLADAIKMIFKEDFVPPNADKLLHALAPMLSVLPPLVLLGAVPFADTLCLNTLARQPWAATVLRDGVCGEGAVPMQVVTANFGILYMFALAGMGIIGATIAGWASDNKFALLGALRAASQLVSYEVAIGISLVGWFMTTQSLRLEDIARWQGENTWGIFAQPLAFVLFFAAATAESKRTPFDLPEGESEIVAGYFLEYSGMKFGMFYLGEYVEIAVMSALLVALFLGGYQLPFLHRDGITVALGDSVFWKLPLPHLTIIILQTLTFFGKTLAVCWFQMFVRWSLPRFRYDQLMNLGWRMLLPAALVNIVLTGLALVAIDNGGEETRSALSWLCDLSQWVVAAGLLFVLFATVRGVVVLVWHAVRPSSSKNGKLQPQAA